MIVITPTGVDYADLVPESISVVDVDGRHISGESPSSELPLHLALYRAGQTAPSDVGTRPRAGTHAVVHTHSPYATAAGLLTDELPPIHYLMAMFAGPVRVAPYATFGSEQLAEVATKAIAGRYGCLLGNHGAVTTGHTLAAAYDRAVQLEWLCQVWLTARTAGQPRLLPAGELGRVVARLETYGAAGRDT